MSTTALAPAGYRLPQFQTLLLLTIQIRRHSVLLVTEQDGSQKVMDGTPEQFGWPRSTWLLSSSQFITERVRPDYPNPEFVDHEGRSRCDRLISLKHGYWALVKEKMEELFGELMWDHLRVLSRAQRVEQVK
ncbi:hypothetical protein CC86DRAFT_420560, partial [Ophiobolus disseminans]